MRVIIIIHPPKKNATLINYWRKPKKQGKAQVWQRIKNLFNKIYKITGSIPKELRNNMKNKENNFKKLVYSIFLPRLSSKLQRFTSIFTKWSEKEQLQRYNAQVHPINSIREEELPIKIQYRRIKFWLGIQLYPFLTLFIIIRLWSVMLFLFNLPLC